MQGQPAYCQARSPHPLTSGGSEGAAAVLADWRMNPDPNPVPYPKPDWRTDHHPGSDPDLTRHDVPSHGASSPLLNADGASAAMMASPVSGSRARSSEAAAMHHDGAAGASIAAV